MLNTKPQPLIDTLMYALSELHRETNEEYEVFVREAQEPIQFPIPWLRWLFKDEVVSMERAMRSADFNQKQQQNSKLSLWKECQHVVNMVKLGLDVSNIISPRLATYILELSKDS